MSAAMTVWIFVGEGARFPAGVFADQPSAEAWIARHKLTGVLTEYPVGVGVWDDAVARGNFTPKRDDQRSAAFIGRFSSASQEHVHFEAGERAGRRA